MTTWVAHGFNVWDNGAGSVDRLHPYLRNSQDFDYGWVGLLSLRCVNARSVRELTNLAMPGDSIVAHSNGCLIAWEVSQRVPLSSVVCINPALRRDTVWPCPVLCLANSTDWVVSLGRMWGRLTSLGGLTPHGWGVAGRYGFDEGAINWDTAAHYWEYPAKGHSGVFRHPEYWGPMIERWLHEPKTD